MIDVPMYVIYIYIYFTWEIQSLAPSKHSCDLLQVTADLIVAAQISQLLSPGRCHWGSTVLNENSTILPPL
jgi:hypothetical protein